MAQEKSKTETQAQTQEILRAISTEIPFMIKNILATVFSEDSGRALGKSAAAYYGELRKGGIPEEAAVKLTDDYMRAFTSLADLALPKGLRERKIDRDADAAEKVSKEKSKQKP
jgi:hypothetical protein